jgi:DNA-binding transcriptional LysR family regulator
LERLPVAAAGPSCAWRSLLVGALQKTGRAYRVAYTSPNFSTVCAAVLQGLAVAAMPRICVKPGMRILTPVEGFPPLGAFDIGLIIKAGRISPAAAALADQIRDSLGTTRKLVAAA